MKISYGTDTGVVRSDNQDSVFAQEYSLKSGLFIVADGMGGYRGGKIASSTAIEVVSAYFKDNYDNDMNSKEIQNLIQSAIEEANAQIYEKSLSDVELNGMGTTLVVMFVKDKTLYTANVGDSRAYLCSGKRIYQITTDHSLVSNLILRGIISSEEAKTHPQKNVITRAVGSEKEVMVDFYETVLSSGDILIACTDGLHSLVDNAEIADVVSDEKTDVADKLISLANEKGGRDNITVIAVKIS